MTRSSISLGGPFGIDTTNLATVRASLARMFGGWLPTALREPIDLTYEEVTFTVEGQPQHGRYALGDLWVTPCTVAKMTPEAERTEDPVWTDGGPRRFEQVDRYIHCAMLGYAKTATPHYYAENALDSAQGWGFVPELQVDPGLTGEPVAMEATGDTIIKAVSLPARQTGWNGRPCIRTLAHLTCVAAPPAAGSFRPAPGVTDPMPTVADLKWPDWPEHRIGGALGSIPPEKLLDVLKRPFWMQSGRFDGDANRKYVHEYGYLGYTAQHAIGPAFLWLCAGEDDWHEHCGDDFPYALGELKRRIALRLVQIGLDAMELVSRRHIKAADGNSVGLLHPAALASMMTGRDMPSPFLFSEGCQFIEVSDWEIDYGRRNDRRADAYTEDMRGLPEFGGQARKPVRDGEWTTVGMDYRRHGSQHAMAYRRAVQRMLWPQVLATARIPGLEDVLNFAVIRDYLDRMAPAHRWDYAARGGAWDRVRGNDAWTGPPERIDHPVIEGGAGRITASIPDYWPHDADLDAIATYHCRWRLVGEDRWQEATRRDGAFTLEVSPGDYEVQMCQDVPGRGRGPWSFRTVSGWPQADRVTVT